MFTLPGMLQVAIIKKVMRTSTMLHVTITSIMQDCSHCLTIGQRWK